MIEQVDKSNMDIVRILELCRDVELYCGEIYRFYSEVFSDDPEVAALWEKTANEEDNHANQFVMAIKLRKQGIIESLNIDHFLANNTLNVIKMVYDGIRECRPTLSDALRSAIKMEEKLAEFHLSYMANFSDLSHKLLFESMMKADNQHIGRLKDMYKRVLAQP